MRSIRFFSRFTRRISLPFLGLALFAAPSAHAIDKNQYDSHDTLASSSATVAPVSHSATTSDTVEASPEDDTAIKVSALLGYSTNDLNLGLGARVGTNRFFPQSTSAERSSTNSVTPSPIRPAA